MNTDKSETFKKKRLNILLSLGMNVNKNTFSKLFGPSIIKSFNSNSDEIRVERIKFILKVYALWVNLKQNNENININIYDLFNSYLARGYSFTEILVDYKHIIKNKAILGYANNDKKTDNEEKQNECNISSCYLTERHEREKNYYSINKERNNKLFFIKKDNNYNNDNESDEKVIVIQDMLDTMHYYVNHCIRIDFDNLVKDNIKVNDHIDDDDIFKNINELTKDKIAEKLTQIMRNTRNRSSRFRPSNRINQFSKFMLTNTYKSTGLSKDTLVSNVNNNGSDDNVHPCFRDDLFNEIFMHKISEKYFDELYDMIVDEEYDTDAAEMDINNNKLKQS